MQDVAVDILGAQVLERTRHRLRHLRRKWRLRIVWKPVVLAGAIRVLGLQKQPFALHHSFAVQRRERLAHTRFEIMASLIGGIDRTKSRAHGQFHQCGGSIFLPGGSVDEAGSRWTRGERHAAILTCRTEQHA